MSTTQLLLPAFFSNDAEFRTWGKGVSDGLAAVGMVKTADTGQIDWATAIRPAASAFAGYEMWRFSDALQATKPVFIKIEYGVASAITTPNMAFTVGTVTNGAGAFTGPGVGTRKVSASALKAAGVLLPTYISAGSNRLALLVNADQVSSNFAMGCIVERTKTGDGVSTGAAIITHLGIVTANYQFQTVLFEAVPSVAGSQATMLPYLRLSDPHCIPNIGQDLAISPMFICLGKWYYGWPISYRRADLADLVPFTISHLGGVHTFLPLGIAGPPASVATDSVAILWE